jgi:hypothetical protein
MKRKPNKLMKLINNGPTTVNHGKGGVKWNWCSNALPSVDAIAKGQCGNPSDSKTNVVLTLFGANTNKLLGKIAGSCFILMK